MPLNQHDHAFQAFQAFRQKHAEYLADHYSEADTRVKFIDRILVDVLGWDEMNQIRREERYRDDENQRCIDYLLSTNIPVLVVEAKRNLVKFEIPEQPQRNLYSLDGIIRKWPNAWAAVKQARAYSDAKGARYALITNGSQFIAFRTASDAGPWDSKRFLAFRSLEALEDGFPLFYECLSPHTIARDKLSQIALGVPERDTRSRARAQLPQLTGGYRNELFAEIDPRIRPYLLDMPKLTPDFLRECYSTSDDDKHQADRLKSLLQDPIPTFITPIDPVKPGHKQDPFAKRVTKQIQSGTVAPVTVVMGGTGVGKTTFLHWFFTQQLPHEEQEKVVLAWCDYRAIECEPEHVHDRTIREVVSKLNDVAAPLIESFPQKQEMFRKEIEAARRGTLAPWADSPDWPKKVAELIQELEHDKQSLLEHITAYLHKDGKRIVVIVLDNMDQKSPQLQEKLYHTAQELSARVTAITIIALRESTFRRNLRTRVFDAFSHIDFHVKARPIVAILRRRFAYMRKVEGPRKLHVSAGTNMVYEVTMDRILDTLSASFCDDQRPECTEALQCLSNSDIRRQLELLYRSLVSGQTKLADYLGAYVDGTARTILFHEFLHSVILGDRRIFVEDQDGAFINIFEPGPGPADSHFTSLRILAVVHMTTEQTGELRERDFLPLSTVAKAFAHLGLSEDDIAGHLRRLCRFGLLVSESQDPTANVCTEPLALSPCGYYYYRQLYCEFAYFSLMALDTSLFDPDVAGRIASRVRDPLKESKLPINARIAAARDFLNYLAGREEHESRAMAVANHPVFSTLRFTPAMKSSLDEVVIANTRR